MAGSGIGGQRIAPPLQPDFAKRRITHLERDAGEFSEDGREGDEIAPIARWWQESGEIIVIGQFARGTFDLRPLDRGS